jgi:hypothetical protein
MKTKKLLIAVIFKVSLGGRCEGLRVHIRLDHAVRFEPRESQNED